MSLLKRDSNRIVRATAWAVAISTGFLGCAREQVPVPKRVEIEAIGSPDRAPLERLGHRIAITGSACEALTKLSVREGSAERFSLLGRADFKLSARGSKLGGRGHVELAESPFTRLILAEKFKVPTDDEFVEAAEEERRAGRLSGIELTALKTMRRLLPKKFRATKYEKTSEKLAEKFPGLFGRSGEIDASMSVGFLTKIAAEKGDVNEISKLASTSTPLFAGATWRDFADEAETSLQAAVSGLKSTEASERTCGLVLLQRGFAQLLTLKGYQSPPIVSSGSSEGPKSKTPILSASNREFRKLDVNGAWIPATQGSPIVLSSEAISGYDPVRQFMTLSATPTERRGAKGTFADQVALLEALTIFFEATSPAAAWHEQTYPYGDIAESPTALLPPDAHSLALGMMIMSFKNVAALGIQKVNAEGSLLQPGQSAAGIVLGQVNPSTKKAVVSAENVARFVNAVVFLETSLQAFAKRPVSEWKKVHATYEAPMLARLAGRAVFTAHELSSLLSESEQEGILMNSLEQLHLPLAMLLTKLQSGPICVSEAEWNSETGDISVLGLCDAKTKAQLQLAKERLARLTNASILIDR